MLYGRIGFCLGVLIFVRKLCFGAILGHFFACDYAAIELYQLEICLASLMIAYDFWVVCVTI